CTHHLAVPILFFFYSVASHLDLHSFPTRRSSDLCGYPIRKLERFSMNCSLPSSKEPQTDWASNSRRMGNTWRRKRWRMLLSYERSEEHTSELQSHLNLVCRLLLEKKKNKNESIII